MNHETGLDGDNNSESSFSFLYDEGEEVKILVRQIKGDRTSSIYINDPNGKTLWCQEDIGIGHLVKLKDYLNYAIKDEQICEEHSL